MLINGNTNILATYRKSVSAASIPILTGRTDICSALSLDKLNADYVGNCIDVRRDSDNVETGIGFIGNSLDTATLLSFAGSANVYVKRLFDQSGHGRNVEQLTNAYQPKIVDSGSLVTGLNNKPAMFFSSAGGGFLKTAVAFPTPISGTVFFVGKHDVILSPDVRAYTFGFYDAVELSYKTGGTRFQWDLYNKFGSVDVAILYTSINLVDIWQRARWDNSVRSYTAKIKETSGTTTNSGTYGIERAAETGHLQLGGSKVNGTEDYFHEMIILDDDCGAVEFLNIETDIETRYAI